MMATKRGPYQSLLHRTEAKRRKTERDKARGKHKIFIGGELVRWLALKKELGLKTHQQLAILLLDSYQNSRLTTASHSTPMKRTYMMPAPPSASEISSGPSQSDNEPLPGPSTQETVHLSPTKGRAAAKELSSIYADPLLLSLSIVEEKVDEDEADRDDVYEPSIDITLDLGNEMKAIPMSEVVFGHEEEEQWEEMHEQDLGTGVRRALDRESLECFVDDKTFLVYFKQIENLAQHCFLGAKCKMKNCEEGITLQHKIVGSVLFLSWVCNNRHKFYEWSSQPLLNRMMGFGDMMISASILASGNNFAKVRLFAKCLNLSIPLQTTFNKIQRTYMVPAVEKLWTDSQESLFKDVEGRGVICLDGRMDSPGHCAQYCSYTIMDNETKKILSISTVDKREVAKKSANSEKAGFIKCLDELLKNKIDVIEVVTDAHPQITSLMRLQYKQIKHSHDIWHAAKNLCKKIIAAGQDPQCRPLQQWSRDITNHFWHACKEASTTEEWMTIWCGVLHHVCNEHSWAVSYGGPAGGECGHGELSEGERTKPWLTKGSPAHNALIKIVLATRLLNKVPYFLNFRHTSEIETFQNQILMNASKRFAYTPPVYKARNLLAALDYNEHVERPYLTNQKGEICYNRCYNKKSGRWTAYPLKVKKTYTHLRKLFIIMLEKRLDDTIGMSRKRVLTADDPRRISTNIAPIPPEPTTSIVEAQKTRFT